MLIFLELDHYAYLHDEKQCQVAIIHLQIISPVTSTENDSFYGPSLIGTICIIKWGQQNAHTLFTAHIQIQPSHY
jgi:hypothetical protein